MTWTVTCSNSGGQWSFPSRRTAENFIKSHNSFWGHSCTVAEDGRGGEE